MYHIAGRVRTGGDRAGHLSASAGHRMVPSTQRLLCMGQLRTKRTQDP